MNRAERRRREKAKAPPGKAPSGKAPSEGASSAQWRTLLDMKPIADGMTISYLLYLLNEKEVFSRHGKLLTASLWLQSQMVGLICLHDDPDLRALYKVDHGRHFPYRLHEAAIKRLETLSSGSLRNEFLERFGAELTTELADDLEWALVDRDALAHGHLSLFRQLSGTPHIAWSPKPNAVREEFLGKIAGPRPDNTYFGISLEALDYEDSLRRICRLMDFIASRVKRWGIEPMAFI